MKYLLTLAFILFVTVGIDAQCSLTLKDAPAIRGLKFGMSGKDVIATIGKPLKNLDPNRNHWAYNPEMQQTEIKGLDGITLLQLGFDSDRLTDINVDYSLQVHWENAEEFTKNLSANLNLPNSAWTFDRMDDRQAEMVCKEFAIEIDTHFGGRLHLVDLVDLHKKADDKNTKDAEWKKAFKP